MTTMDGLNQGSQAGIFIPVLVLKISAHSQCSDACHLIET